MDSVVDTFRSAGFGIDISICIFIKSIADGGGMQDFLQPCIDIFIHRC